MMNCWAVGIIHPTTIENHRIGLDLCLKFERLNYFVKLVSCS